MIAFDPCRIKQANVVIAFDPCRIKQANVVIALIPAKLKQEVLTSIDIAVVFVHTYMWESGHREFHYQ